MSRINGRLHCPHDFHWHCFQFRPKSVRFQKTCNVQQKQLSVICLHIWRWPQVRLHKCHFLGSSNHKVTEVLLIFLSYTLSLPPVGETERGRCHLKEEEIKTSAVFCLFKHLFPMWFSFSFSCILLLKCVLSMWQWVIVLLSVLFFGRPFILPEIPNNSIDGTILRDHYPAVRGRTLRSI